MSELGVCDRCGKSPWVHPLRGAWLYCTEIGGEKGSFTQEEVNIVRVTIGKKKVLAPRVEAAKRKAHGPKIMGTAT